MGAVLLCAYLSLLHGHVGAPPAMAESRTGAARTTEKAGHESTTVNGIGPESPIHSESIQDGGKSSSGDANAIAAGGSEQCHPVSMLSLFWQADLVVKGVMALLLLASVHSWGIILGRLAAIRRIRKKITAFDNLFWSGQPLDVIFKKLSKEANPAPTASVLISAMEEYYVRRDSQVAFNIKERLFNAMTIAANRSIHGVQQGFGALAAIANMSPFIGLFGTVWGIMTTFPSIAASKHVTIAAIAPGMAEALLATAFGLVAAIPAGIFYNKFMADLQSIEAKTEEFKIELTNIMLRDLADEGGR